MDFRRLIMFGKSSYVVSVPKSWVIENGLGKGDLIYIQETPDSLILRAKEKKQQKGQRTIVIDANKKDIRLIRSEIVSAYLSNFDIIKIQSDRLMDNSKEIASSLSGLIGLELIEQNETKIVAKVLLDTKEISLSALIRRIDVILRSMIEDVNKNESDHENIRERDKDVNKLTFLIKRVIKAAIMDSELAKTLNVTNLELLRDHKIVSYLERIGDRVKRIATLTTYLEEKNKALMTMKELFSEFSKSYLSVMKSYHTLNIELAYTVEMNNKELMNKCIELGRELNDPNAREMIYNFKGMSNAIRNVARNIIC